MAIRNTRENYGLIAKILHWLIAVIMIGLIGVGWYMVRLSDEDVLYWRLLDLHEAAGLSLFILWPVKVVWMAFSPNPKFLPTLAAWELGIAGAVRWLFIVAIVVIPLSGFLFVATNGEAIRLYDLITIPDIGEVAKGTRDWLSDIHYYASYSCAALIVIHILAALKHHFIDADATLRRMTLYRSREPTV
jgi:cytochrome b561